MVGTRAVALLLIAVMFAGCAAESDIHGNGTTSSTETSTEDCSDGDGTVRVSTNGSGKIDITVTDGLGLPIYTKNIDGTGQNHDDQSISGEPGTWKLTAKFSGNSYSTSGFTGQWSIGLSC